MYSRNSYIDERADIVIASLKGILVAREADGIVLDVGGVGFSVGMSTQSLSRLPSVGATVQIHTYLQVREDALTLFGFTSVKEKALFEKLLSVSGIGPKVALSALSSFTPDALTSAIMTNDVTGVSRIPGIGKKTAQRIILELQGSLDVAEQTSDQMAVPSDTQLHHRALDDLLALGFSSTEAELALKGAPKDATEASLVQYALKRLGE